jgi:hypothetical protein
LKESTPVNVKRLQYELRVHSDLELNNFVINGFNDGFLTGLSKIPDTKLECKNLLSTKTYPSDVSRLVESELENNFIIGPFKSSPFDVYRVSPIGIVEGKYSMKKRLILDLSAPHRNTEHQSLNDLISKEEFSLSYIKVDAIKTNKKYGKGDKCCKTDISNAFKLVSVHSSLWHLYGFKWNDNYYFYTRLAFGSRSSRKLFDCFSSLFCWILQQNYGIRNVLHLLDDFLTIKPP